MKKVIRLTESELITLIGDIAHGVKQQQVNEDLVDTAWNAGKQVGNKIMDTAISAGDKIGLSSDWWSLVPGVKIPYESMKFARQMQKQPFEKTMEDIRSFASGVKGTVVAVILDAVEVGAIINPVFWGLYTIYDCWLASINKLNIFNIIMDIIGVATAGVGAAFVKKFFSILGPFAKSGVGGFVNAMMTKAPKLFNYVAPILKNGASIISKAVGMFNKAVPQLSKKLPFLASGLQKMKSGITYLQNFIKSFNATITAASTKRIGQTATQVAKKTTQLGKTLGKEIVKGKTIETGLGTVVSQPKKT